MEWISNKPENCFNNEIQMSVHWYILSAANIFRSVFLGVQINPIFSIYVCILYLSCNVKKTKITDKFD